MKNNNKLTDIGFKIFQVFGNFNKIMSQKSGVVNIFNSRLEKAIKIIHNSSDFGKSWP